MTLLGLLCLIFANRSLRTDNTTPLLIQTSSHPLPSAFSPVERAGLTMFLSHIQVSQEECAGLREGVPYVKVYRYKP